MSKKLTKDADKLLCVLYKEFHERRGNGETKANSQYFGDSDEIQNKYFSDKSTDDIADVCWELNKAGYLSCCPGDDIANEITLTNDAIVYMENRFKNGLKDVIQFLALFKP